MCPNLIVVYISQYTRFELMTFKINTYKLKLKVSPLLIYRRRNITPCIPRQEHAGAGSILLTRKFIVIDCCSYTSKMILQIKNAIHHFLSCLSYQVLMSDIRVKRYSDRLPFLFRKRHDYRLHHF